MSNILEVHNLIKEFPLLRAVDGISLAIPEGICFGLLGPNGAGKTTTIEMIEGITPPTDGEILYRGKPCGERFSLESGIQFQSTALMDYLTTREVLKLFGSLYPNPHSFDELVELCQLGEFLNSYATELSGGQRQRLLLAVALVNNPAILFLDEPTTGLDPQSRRNFWDLIGNIKAQGKTILLTTHYMDEAEVLCDQLVIMDHGKIIAEGTPKNLLKQHFGHSYVCIDKKDFNVSPEQLPEQTVITGEHYELETQSISTTIDRLISLNVDLRSLRVRSPTLDDLFLKLTGHSLRD